MAPEATMTKLVKNLIIVNGILFPGLFLTFVFIFAYNHFTKANYNDYSGYTPSGTQVNNSIINTAGDTIVFQGIEYCKPVRIGETSNYILAIHPKEYKRVEVKKKSSIDLLGEIQTESKISYSFSLANEDTRNDIYNLTVLDCVNILFLDENFKITSTVLNHKGFIKSASVRYDKSRIKSGIKNYFTFYIAHVDGNKDGVINCYDQADLYISDLSGAQLTKVTNKLEVRDIQFINNNEDILIAYNEIGDKPDEHKRVKFMQYNINSKTYKELHELDKGIDNVYKILNEVK